MSHRDMTEDDVNEMLEKFYNAAVTSTTEYQSPDEAREYAPHMAKVRSAVAERLRRSGFDPADVKDMLKVQHKAELKKNIETITSTMMKPVLAAYLELRQPDGDTAGNRKRALDAQNEMEDYLLSLGILRPEMKASDFKKLIRHLVN